MHGAKSWDLSKGLQKPETAFSTLFMPIHSPTCAFEIQGGISRAALINLDRTLSREVKHEAGGADQSPMKEAA